MQLVQLVQLVQVRVHFVDAQALYVNAPAHQYPYVHTNLNGQFNVKVAQRLSSSHGYGYPYGENHSPALSYGYPDRASWRASKETCL